MEGDLNSQFVVIKEREETTLKRKISIDKKKWGFIMTHQRLAGQLVDLEEREQLLEAVRRNSRACSCV